MDEKTHMMKRMRVKTLTALPVLWAIFAESDISDGQTVDWLVRWYVLDLWWVYSNGSYNKKLIHSFLRLVYNQISECETKETL